MATRSRTTFQKRQKELARIEKQRDKAARRIQRKLAGPEVEPEDMPLGEGGEPIDPADPSIQSESAIQPEGTVQPESTIPAGPAKQSATADQAGERPAVVE
jgi:hypothetical protein